MTELQGRTIRAVDVTPGDLAAHADAIAEIHRGTLDCVVLRRAFPEPLRAAILERLANGELPWLRPNSSGPQADIRVLGNAATPTFNTPGGPAYDRYFEDAAEYGALYDQLLAQASGSDAIEELLERISGGRPVRRLALPDGRKSPGPLEVVILDFVTTHAYYETDFDAKNPTPPACFAIGNDPKNMVPSPNSPVQQSTECKTCPMNQFGPNNERKACTNRRLMAVLPPDADESTPIWTIETAPMSNKAFDAYVSGIVAAKGVPPIGVVTEISLDPNVDYAKLVFGLVDDNPAVGEMLGRQEEAKKLLAVEPNTSSYAAPTKKAAGARRR